MTLIRRGCLPFMIGTVLGLVVIVLQNFTYEALFIPEAQQSILAGNEQFLSLVLCVPVVALLGGAGAVLFGEETARRGRERFRLPAVLLGGLLVPVLFFLLSYMVTDDYWIDYYFDYRRARHWNGRLSLYEYNLYQRDLAGLRLAGADLRRADLRGANLQGADLTGACLEEARLNGTDFSGATLAGVCLGRAWYDPQTRWPAGFDYQHCGAYGSEAVLRGIDLHGRDLRQVNFSHADLRDTDLRGVNCGHAVFSGADLRGARLNGANLAWSSMNEALLDGADLSGANLNGARLQAADLSGADLGGVDVSGAWYSSSTKWPAGFDPQTKGARLSGG